MGELIPPPHGGEGNETPGITWAIDAFVVGEDSGIFVYGWLMHEQRELNRLTLKVGLGTAREVMLVAEIHRERSDVASAYPGNSQARNAGFHLMGNLGEDAVTSATLTYELDDQSRGRIAIPLELVRTCHVKPLSRGSMKAYRHLVKRTLKLLFKGEVSNLRASIGRFLKNRPRAHAVPVSALLKLAARSRNGVVVIVDHSLGGGANQFREALQSRLLDGGESVFVFSLHVASLQYFVEGRVGDRVERVALRCSEFAQLLWQLKVRRIYWNNAVSFTRQIELLEIIGRCARDAGVPITFFLHDYHSICPSHFLLNTQGRYCGLPELAECRQCLPVLEDGLASMFSARDIDLWREKWAKFLLSTDELVYFSHASLALLTRAYPQLREHQGLSFQPHQIPEFPATRLEFDLGAELRIGVVGRIGKQKGASIVGEMLEVMDADGGGGHITIFGSCDKILHSNRLTITGTYERDRLPILMAEHRINMVVFTSICPETFSFVISEVMSMGLPIVTFDIGAQGERVGAYDKGYAVPLGSGKQFMNGAKILQARLMALAQD